MSTKKVIDIETIARICHEAMSALVAEMEGEPHPRWESLKGSDNEWMIEDTKKNVIARINNPMSLMSLTHEAWKENRIDNGWVWGETKCSIKKTHPCLVPYGELPDSEILKDQVFTAIVDRIAPFLPAEDRKESL